MTSLNENVSAQAQSARTESVESAEELGGRWVVDPNDPEFEVWEPAKAEGDGFADTAPMKTGVTPLWSMEGRPNQCVGHKKDGTRCRRAAIAGGTVCRVHGGAAPAVKAAARARLEMAADRMAKNLLKMAVDDDVADGVRLAATNSALDRAGLSAKTAVEVEVGPSKGFEQILNAMITGGSRAESRSRRGEPADPNTADSPDDDWTESEVMDAQVVEDYEVLPPPPRPRPDEPPRPAAARSAEPTSGLMDLEDALDQLHRTAPPPQTPAPRRNRQG